MTMIPNPTTDELKHQARRLRQAMADRGTPVAHGTALELVAKSHGARDWNTLAARRPADTPPSTPKFAIGDAVCGRYLGQAFQGRIVSLAKLPATGLLRVAVHFDQPVDVVTFDSFSAFRSRVTAVITDKGVSPRRTSNGLPQLVLETRP
jgi:hypothetical protein